MAEHVIFLVGLLVATLTMAGLILSGQEFKKESPRDPADEVDAQTLAHHVDSTS